MQLASIRFQFRAVAAVFAASALLGSASPEDLLETIDSRDAKELLEAGIRLEERGKASLAIPCYRRVLKLGPGEAYAEAAYRLGTQELSREEYESAWSHLREAALKQSHAGAREKLARAETKETREQWSLVEAGDASFEKGKWLQARKDYEKAWKLFPPKASAAPFLPRKDLLKRLARCADLIDDEYYRDVVQPAERSIQACTECTQENGFVRCGSCGGEGLVKGTRQDSR